ncbi:MAG: hypothetical protein V3R70_06525, partial [Syntrophobacteria bacterium]
RVKGRSRVAKPAAKIIALKDFISHRKVAKYYCNEMSATIVMPTQKWMPQCNHWTNCGLYIMILCVI